MPADPDKAVRHGRGSAVGATQPGRLQIGAATLILGVGFQFLQFSLCRFKQGAKRLWSQCDCLL